MHSSILIVFAFVFSLIAAFSPYGYYGPADAPYWHRISLGWLAMACFFASLIWKL